MSNSLISFDAAGTLIQVREQVAVTYARMARVHGVEIREADLKSAFHSVWSRLPPPLWPEGEGSPDDDRLWWRELVHAVFAEALGVPLPAGLLDALFDELYAHYANAEAWTVFDDVRPALAELQQDHTLCVLSNFDRRLRTILRGHELDGFFAHIILSSEVGAAKPHGRMFGAALRLHDAIPEASLHVGDDLHCDVEGAAAQGWHAFHVARPASGLALLVEKVRSGAYYGLRSAQKSIANPPLPCG
ncbi:MAG: HAD-IA family hydrolase [Prosthecobacter sp.]|nr:HAD-IA family hydrolase [Prosthecobacter sp.]